MNRSQFLRKVGDTLTKRQHSYGHLDVCIMMILTKAMRLKQDPLHIDSYEDIAGYSALAVELISTLVRNGDRPEKVVDLENDEDQCMHS